MKITCPCCSWEAGILSIQKKIFGLVTGAQAVVRHDIQTAAFNSTSAALWRCITEQGVRSWTSRVWQTPFWECHNRQNQNLLICKGVLQNGARMLYFKVHMVGGCCQLLTTAALLFLHPRKGPCKALPPPAWFCLSYGTFPSPEGTPWQLNVEETLSHCQKAPI